MQVAFGKKVSAWAPVLMSLAALGLVGIQLAAHGVSPEPDEGALAHLYQLLVAGQLPVIAYFAFHWWRRAPWRGWPVIVVQMLGLAAALVPVHMLGW